MNKRKIRFSRHALNRLRYIRKKRGIDRKDMELLLDTERWTRQGANLYLVTGIVNNTKMRIVLTPYRDGTWMVVTNFIEV